MTQYIPPARPRASRAIVEKLLQRYGAHYTDRASLVFVRGYYLDALGKAGANDINVYDDAAFILSPTLFESFNANTDPSFVRLRNRPLAQLALGHYEYYRGLHKGRYPALRPYPEGREMPCTRDGAPSKAIATNIHKGGMRPSSAGVTWSEGCLTIPSVQYPEWQLRVWHEMDKYEQKVIDVILVENREVEGRQQLVGADGRVIA